MAQTSRIFFWHDMSIGLSLKVTWLCKNMVCKLLVGLALDATCHLPAISKHPCWAKAALRKLRLGVDTAFIGLEAFQDLLLAK